MFLEFACGHWLSMYRNRFTSDVPPLEARTMTKGRRAGVELAGDVPNLSTHSGKFMFKLLTGLSGARPVVRMAGASGASRMAEAESERDAAQRCVAREGIRCAT